VTVRNFLFTLFVLAAGLALGYYVARQAIGTLGITSQEKALPDIHRLESITDRDTLLFPLRMVDMGGVGIVPDTSGWGSNYEHNQHFFEEVLQVAPPFIDTDAFVRECGKFDYFAGHMATYGYNAIALPWFLECVNFDLLENGRQVYGEKSIYRDRHDTLSSRFHELMKIAAEHGLSTYLWTDMVALTPPLKDYFERSLGSVDTENPEFWQVYGKAAEEVFAKFPCLDGIIIRIGEAGSIYNKPGWDYTSELYVKTGDAVKMMLEAFLNAAAKYEKNIIFRTWSVGVGEIGDMHTNPGTYRKVLGDVHSEHLVVSTKYCNGDFYSWLELNPTLLEGEHRRIAEFQTKREYEGFGSLPNYVAPLHQAALQDLAKMNPHMEGAWVWTQYGGPLRAGPMIIYPFHGFNVINEVNVYATSRLIMDPFENLDTITSEWIRGYFGGDSVLVANLSQFLRMSHDVIGRGLYISEFAKYKVRALGLEPPPMLWIFEWDILGASSAVFSNIYFITKDRLGKVVEEGFTAVRGAVAMKELLLEAKEGVTVHQDEYDRLIASAEYEIELLRVMAYYRQFFMNYYRWLDRGDARAHSGYKLAMGQFSAVKSFHREKYAGDLNTLGMDFEEVDTGMQVAGNTPVSIAFARVYMVVILFLLLMGIPGFIRDRAHKKFAATLFFDALFRPRSISSLHAYHGTSQVACLLVILYLLSMAVFSSFTSWMFPLVMGTLGLLYVIILAVFFNSGRDYTKILVTLMAPKVIIMLLVMGVAAIRGPMFFWYQFWVSDLFKLIFFSLFFMLLFRKFQVYVMMGRKWMQRSGAAAGGLVMMVLGIQMLIAGSLMLYFGLEESLTAMNNDLLVLPGGLSKILGITTHLDIPKALPLWIIYISAGLAIPGFLLFIPNRKRII